MSIDLYSDQEIESDDEQEIIWTLDEILTTGYITDEMTSFIDLNWHEFITIALTHRNGKYWKILDMFVQDGDGKLNIEYHTYIDLINEVKNTPAEEYLESIVDYSIDDSR
jgi:major membrane immunogen (membrane-anchored lipoprotein)